MPRPPLPKVLADVFDDRQARTTLLAGAFALFAAGLDPKVWGPSLSTVQAAIRERPSLEAYVILGVVASAILLLVGGAIGDLRRARPLIVGGLATLVVTGTVGLLFPAGPVFIAARLVGAAASALTVPAALASVALAYRGVARATALGIAYAVYSGALAVMPILLTFIPGAQWPGFVVAPIAALVALIVVRGRIPTSSGQGALSDPTSSAPRCGRAPSSRSRRAFCGWAAGWTSPFAGRSSASGSRSWSPSGSSGRGVESPIPRSCRSTGDP